MPGIAEGEYSFSPLVYQFLIFLKSPAWPAISPRTIENRLKVVAKVETAIKWHFGGAYLIRVFGSTCYGADTDDSDLDLVIMVCG